MKVYVAGSSKDMARVENAIGAVRSLGHAITFDWPAHVRANPGGANVGSDEVLRAAALLCHDGACKADLVWVVAPPVDKPTAGAWWEAAAAWGLGIPVIVSAPEGLAQFCIFTHMPTVRRFESDDAALTSLFTVSP